MSTIRSDKVSSTRADAEANTFALCFLMPSKLFIRIANKYTVGGKCDLGKVAKEFKVETEMAHIRGQMLGLW